jgi:hypothetical protein
LTLDQDGIMALVNSYERQSRAIKDEILRFCWYMRGGINYNDAMFLSSDERKIISEIIKDNLETSKKSGLPFF